MNVDIGQIVSISEANQNFSRVASMAERLGEIYVFKNNKPRYKIVAIGREEPKESADVADGE